MEPHFSYKITGLEGNPTSRKKEKPPQFSLTTNSLQYSELPWNFPTAQFFLSLTIPVTPSVFLSLQIEIELVYESPGTFVLSQWRVWGLLGGRVSKTLQPLFPSSALHWALCSILTSQAPWMFLVSDPVNCPTGCFVLICFLYCSALYLYYILQLLCYYYI